VAGAVPVEPAATSTSVGGFSAHCFSRARRSFTRRSETSIRPSASRRCGQAVSTPFRKRAETCQCWARSPSARPSSRSANRTSSIWQLSRKSDKALASSSAWTGPGLKDSLSPWSTTSRASSKRRRREEMAGGKSRDSSPGSNGGSPSSRSPSGRICGSSSARPPPTARKASARARAPRRVGVRTVARGRASGPSGSSAFSRPRARSSTNGRWAGIENQRGPSRSKKGAGPVILLKVSFRLPVWRRDRRHASRARLARRRGPGGRPPAASTEAVVRTGPRARRR
jgi:hypothetical protein